MNRYIRLLILLLIGPFCWAQITEVPVIGAQVYIEPGQTKEQIKEWFRILKEQNMKVCRLRMFENYIEKDGEQWDFNLFDVAFDAAYENDIKVFVTLFPETDAIGGFKFPKDERHLERVQAYIRKTVTHYKDHPALAAWVLINEPGQGNLPLYEQLTRKRYQEWLKARTPSDYNNDFSKMDLSKEEFFRDHNTWYLRLISEEIGKIDVKTPHHVNPHGIFGLLPQYDFSAWRPFLASLGASMHPSWHFGDFDRKEFPLAVSANNDIIIGGSGENPYWVTELQGGNNLWTAYKPMSPTREEIAQWLWTSIAGGTEGIIFWTLNAYTTGDHAGEWAMLTHQNKPSDRLLVSGEIAGLLQKEADFFRTAAPVSSNVYLLYNHQSINIQARQGIYEMPQMDADFNAARKPNAIITSLLGYYKSLQSLGVPSQIKEMKDFNWEDGKGKVVILPNMISIPSTLWPRIEKFVKNGGKLIVSGLTGYFDENAHHIMLTGFPLEKVFGGNISQYKHVDQSFNIVLDENAKELPAHLWAGEIHNGSGKTIAQHTNGKPAAVRNTYGKGEVLWIPSLVGLEAFLRDATPLATLLQQELSPYMESLPFMLTEPTPGVLLKTMKNDKEHLLMVINKNETEITVPLYTTLKKEAKVVFSTHGTVEMQMATLTVQPEETLILKF